jgi:hypothetical protein
MNQSENINELSAALSKAQGEIDSAKKTSANPFFKSKYADLSEVIKAAKKSLADNGLSVMQMTYYDGAQTQLITQVNHSSGQWIRGSFLIKPVKDDPQGMGSAITYARRYCYAAAIGIAQDDDDAEQAVGRKQKPANDDAARMFRDNMAKDISGAIAAGDELSVREIFDSLGDEKKNVWNRLSQDDKNKAKEMLANTQG